jgi:hypothetical protein
VIGGGVGEHRIRCHWPRSRPQSSASTRADASARR